MRDRFKHLFFDLDHTLWDFERCSQETLIELFDEYKIDLLGKGMVSADLFVKTFREVNRNLWHLYDNHKATKQEIRDKRFPMIFEKIGIPVEVCPTDIGDKYIRRCPKKGHLMEDTIETLEHLQNHYYLHILTNGFSDIQSTKMKFSNIIHYFNSVVTSESTGHRKPSKEIFDYAMEKAGALPENSVMIGDNLKTDIKGANRVGMFAVYYNPEKETHNEQVGMEINQLKELIEIF